MPKNGPPIAADKHAQKQIERMNKAREEKERVQTFLKRGEPKAKQSEDHTLSQMGSAAKLRPQTASSRKSPLPKQDYDLQHNLVISSGQDSMFMS